MSLKDLSVWARNNNLLDEEKNSGSFGIESTTWMEPKNSSWTLSAAEADLQKVQSFKWIRVFVSNPKWGRNMH